MNHVLAKDQFLFLVYTASEPCARQGSVPVPDKTLRVNHVLDKDQFLFLIKHWTLYRENIDVSNLSVRKEQQMYLKGEKSIVIGEMDISYR